MDGFQVKTLFWAKNNVIEEPFMIVSMLNELVMTQFKFNSVGVGRKRFLNKGVVTIVDLGGIL
jgi:hypothetical protein